MTVATANNIARRKKDGCTASNETQPPMRCRKEYLWRTTPTTQEALYHKPPQKSTPTTIGKDTGGSNPAAVQKVKMYTLEIRRLNIMGKFFMSIIVCCASLACPPLGLILLFISGLWKEWTQANSKDGVHSVFTLLGISKDVKTTLYFCRLYRL